MAAIRKRTSVVAACVLAIGLAGCGSGGHVGGHLNFKGHEHPAATVSVSIAVIPTKVVVSPAGPGAGPIIFNVVNTTARTQTVRVRDISNDRAHRRVVASTGRIAAGETAQLKANVVEGGYAVTATSTPTGLLRSRLVKAAKLAIGPPRGGGNDLIEQP